MTRELREKVVALSAIVVRIRGQRRRCFDRGLVWEGAERLRSATKALDKLIGQIERSTTAEQLREEQRERSRSVDTVRARLDELRAENRRRASKAS